MSSVLIYNVENNKSKENICLLMTYSTLNSTGTVSSNHFHSCIPYHVHIPKTLNTSSIPVDYVNQTLDTCPYAYIQMQSMTTSSEIHGYLFQSRFTTSKTLCNYSIFCRCLDTLFKTVNFQFKTLLTVI